MPKYADEFRYTVFCGDTTFFFSTDHLQRFESATGKQIEKEYVPCSGTLPMHVVPRPSLPDGIVDTIEKYLMIFHKDETEIPNPDPKFQPKWRPIWNK